MRDKRVGQEKAAGINVQWGKNTLERLDSLSPTMQVLMAAQPNNCEATNNPVPSSYWLTLCGRHTIRKITSLNAGRNYDLRLAHRKW